MSSRPWSDDEIAAILRAHKRGLKATEIARRYCPSRSPKAVKTKLSTLRQLRVRPVKPAKPWSDAALAKMPERMTDDPLLRALLQYGLRHNVDLGMGRDAFIATARRVGVIVEISA